MAPEKPIASADAAAGGDAAVRADGEAAGGAATVPADRSLSPAVGGAQRGSGMLAADSAALAAADSSDAAGAASGATAPKAAGSTAEPNEPFKRTKKTKEEKAEEKKEKEERELCVGAHNVIDQLLQFQGAEVAFPAATRRRDDRAPLVAAAAEQARKAARGAALNMRKADVFDAGVEPLHISQSLLALSNARSKALKEAIALAEKLQLWLLVLRKLLAAEKLWEADGKRRVKATVGDAEAVVEASTEGLESAARTHILLAAKALPAADLARATLVVTRVHNSTAAAWTVWPRSLGAAITVLPVACDTGAAWCAAEAVLLVDRGSFGRPREDGGRCTTWVLSDASKEDSSLAFQVVYSGNGKQPPRFTVDDLRQLLMNTATNSDKDSSSDAGRFLAIVDDARARGCLRITAGPHFHGRQPLHANVALGVGRQWHIYVRNNDGAASTEDNKPLEWNGMRLVIDSASGGITDVDGNAPTDSVLKLLHQQLAAIAPRKPSNSSMRGSAAGGGAPAATGGAATGGAGAVAVASDGDGDLLEFDECTPLDSDSVASTLAFLREPQESRSRGKPRAAVLRGDVPPRGGVSEYAPPKGGISEYAPLRGGISEYAPRRGGVSEYAPLSQTSGFVGTGVQPRLTWAGAVASAAFPDLPKRSRRAGMPATAGAPDATSPSDYPPLVSSPRVTGSAAAGTSKAPPTSYAAVTLTGTRGAETSAPPQDTAPRAPQPVASDADCEAGDTNPVAAVMQSIAQRVVDASAADSNPKLLFGIVNRAVDEIFSMLDTHVASGKPVFIPMVPLPGRRHVVLSFTPAPSIAARPAAAASAPPPDLLKLQVVDFYVDAALADDTGDWYTVDTGRGELTLVVEARPAVEAVLASAGYDE